MVGKDTPETLIVSYLLGELDEQRQAYVLQQIKTDAQWRQAYEDLLKTVQLIGFKHTAENVDLHKEWAHLEEARMMKQHPERFLNEAERFGNGVIKEVSLRRSTRISRILAASAIAASLLLATGWMLTFRVGQKTASTEALAATPKKNFSPVSLIRQLVNYTGQARPYELEDGTRVMLAPSSTLKLLQPFEPGKRDVYLSGSALFQVASDKTRPFTVFSAGISTTALGTRFTVTASDPDHIRVVLHEGKVVVKGVGEMRRKVPKDYYLVAGQQFVWDKKQRWQASVANTLPGPSGGHPYPKAAVQAGMAPDKPSIPEMGKGSWYMFNNQSLPQVFNQLKSIYKTGIVYDRNELANMYFIGTFNQGDSLETVLKQIAIGNNLKIAKEHRTFIITKQE